MKGRDQSVMRRVPAKPQGNPASPRSMSAVSNMIATFKSDIFLLDMQLGAGTDASKSGVQEIKTIVNRVGIFVHDNSNGLCSARWWKIFWPIISIPT